MKAPDISVVMGVFNNASTLPAALDSVLSQEGVDLEFIVVDDGSTDGTAKILDDAASKDPRLRVVHKPNEGLTRALIDGCALATAPWIARQDADDVSLPGRFAALRDLAARHPDAVLLASSALCLGPKGEELRTVRCTTDPDLARKQVLDLRIGPPAHGSAMFRREAYHAAGGYRSAFYYAQDSDLWMRLAEQGGVVYAGEVLYAFRYAADSISGSRRRIQKIFGKLGRKCREARRAGRSEEVLLAEVRRQCERIRNRGRRPSAHGLALGHYHIGSLLERRQPAAAREYFDAAVAACPWFWKARIKRWRLGRG